MEHKAHADLFDRVVVAVGPERIQPTISKLNQTEVQHREEFDIQPRQPLVLEVVINTLEPCQRPACYMQTVVASSQPRRDLNIRLQRRNRSMERSAHSPQHRVNPRTRSIEIQISAALRRHDAATRVDPQLHRAPRLKVVVNASRPAQRIYRIRSLISRPLELDKGGSGDEAVLLS